MAITPEQLAQFNKQSLDLYERNAPIDQVGTERPWLKFLSSKKKTFPGAKQYIVEQLRISYDSNFQWTQGDDQVSFNKRDPLKQASFAWGSWHDGYSLNEDDLLSNGITLVDGAYNKSKVTATDSEIVQLTNMAKENNAILMEGAREKFDLELLRDGSQSSKSIGGLDSLVSLAPTSGTTGGIARNSTNAQGKAYWQNHAYTGLTTSSGSTYIIDKMDVGWRACQRNGGRPTYIMAGAEFIDTFKAAAKSEITKYTILNTGGQTADYDPALNQAGVSTGLHFNGLPILYNPVFYDLDDQDSPTIPWEKRCYFINGNHISLRPAQGHDMVTRNPTRAHDRYAHYWGLTWKGALTTNRLNSHAVFSVA